MTRSRRPTLRDVAQHAGVSVTTASDALRGEGRLPQHTRDKVAQVARELGYTPNSSARNLRRGRTGTIALYVPDRTVGMDYYMQLAISAAEEALDHQLALTLLPTAREGTASPELHVDGVIVSDPMLGDPTLERLAGLGVPVVTVERDLTPGARHAGRVESDHTAATHALLDHLRAQGAERIALLCPGEDTSFGHDIHRAYASWCRRHRTRTAIRHVSLAWEPEQLGGAVEQLLAAPEPPQAVVAVPDGGAAKALETALRLGRRVPEDLLVAGYVDGLTLRSLAIPVTAVDITPREMGRRAARLLARLVNGEVAPGAVEVLPTTLVVRESTSRS